MHIVPLCVYIHVVNVLAVISNEVVSVMDQIPFMWTHIIRYTVYNFYGIIRQDFENLHVITYNTVLSLNRLDIIIKFQKYMS